MSIDQVLLEQETFEFFSRLTEYQLQELRKALQMPLKFKVMYKLPILYFEKVVKEVFGDKYVKGGMMGVGGTAYYVRIYLNSKQYR